MEGLYSHIGEYNESEEEWPLYMERVTHYLAANGVNDAGKQRALLLSVIEPRTYRLLRSSESPSTPTDKSLAELSKLLEDHFNPKPSVIVQRFRFNSRNRKVGESVAQYLSELQRLSEHCQYGTVLNDILRDSLVVGIANERMQHRLLSEKDLTFARARELALSMETAEQNTEEMKPSLPPLSVRPEEAVNKATAVQVSASKSSKSCYRCTRKDHLPFDCPFKFATCCGCQKVGNVRPACRSKGTRPTQKASQTPRQAEAHALCGGGRP